MRTTRVAAAVLSALSCLVAAEGALGATSRCEPREGYAARSVVDAARPAGEGTQLDLRDPPIDFAFGSRRGYSDRVEVAVASQPLPAGSRIGAEVESDLHRAGGGDSFPVEGILVQTRVTSSGNVQLLVCLDPEVENVDPGRYTGVIQVNGDGIRPTALPLEATLRARREVAILWIVAGLVLGFAVKVAAEARKQAAGDDGAGRAGGRASLPRRARIYVRENAAAIALASVTGVVFGIVAYLTIYGTSPTWGTNEDIGKIVSAGVLSQVTGMTAAEIVKPPAK